jgi:hypothetical protein
MRRWTRGFASLLAGGVMGLNASAAIVAYPDFTGASDLSLQGSAHVATVGGAGILRLASATPSQSGTVFGATKLNAATFSTAFQFRISNAGGTNDSTQEVGGDGFTFLVQNQAVNAVGSSGDALGIGGITPSIAVEFDTYKNPFDSDSNHVGINVGGNTNSVVTANIETVFGSGARLDSHSSTGPIWTAWIDYDGAQFEVRLSNDGTRPTSALLTHTIDLVATLGSDTTFVGFTASTGAAYGTHDILNWAYSDVFVEGGISVVPEPSTVSLLALGVGGGGVVWFIRRRRRNAGR